MKLTNTEVKLLQERLKDIINNIDSNMGIINNEEINETFLQPILDLTVNISDKVFIQTKDTLNEINI